MSRPPNKPLPAIVTSKRKVTGEDLRNFFLTCSEDVRRTYDLMPTLLPGAARLAALAGKRKTADKCRVCQKRCDPNSVLYCKAHLAEALERMRPKPAALRQRRDPRDKTVAAAEKMILLLNCSERFLRRFELARINAANSLRNELQGVLYEQIDAPDLRAKVFATLDALVNQMAQLGLARWFRATDREAIKRAIEIEEDPALHAKKQIREQGRSETELMHEVFRSLDPGEAHRVAALTYAQRNIDAGRCAVCPKPLDPNSVRYCTKHLAAARTKSARHRGVKGEHGRQPGTLASLEMSREKKTRALLAELGIPPESAAVSLKAAKEALLRVMPDSKAKALSPADLFQAAVIPSRTTGNRALRELLSAGKIQRIGKARKGHSCRYFK